MSRRIVPINQLSKRQLDDLFSKCDEPSLEREYLEDKNINEYGIGCYSPMLGGMGTLSIYPDDTVITYEELLEDYYINNLDKLL